MKMLTYKITPTFPFILYPTHDAASAVSDAMNSEEAGPNAWSYKVEENKSGRFLVVAYDEDGFSMGPV